MDGSCISFHPHEQCSVLHSIKIKCFTHEKMGSEGYKLSCSRFENEMIDQGYKSQIYGILW